MLEVKCPEYLEEVRAFARTLGLEDQLQSRLDYLSHYGHAGDAAVPESEQPVCVLCSDFAPHSFAFELYRPDPAAEGGRRFRFNGGIIFQGPNNPANGGAPSFTVSLAEGTGWFIHT